MNSLVLQYHMHRIYKGDDRNEMTGLFLFSLLPENRYQAGEKPTHEDVFWTEVPLSRAVAEQGGWKSLSKDAKIKCMYQHAVEQIVEAKRKLRQAPLIWTTTAKYRNAPCWDLGAIEFPPKRPVPIDASGGNLENRLLARKGAGLSSQ